MIKQVFIKQNIPECMIMNQGSAFKPTLITYFFKKLGIKIKIVASQNHQFLQVEYGVKSLATILTKHLTGLGQYWPKHLPFAIYSFITSCIPN